jgi:hypothetical protein
MWIGHAEFILPTERRLRMRRTGLSKWVSVGMLFAVMLLAVTSTRAAGLPGDTEAAAHGDEAANVQLVKETEQKSAHEPR